MTSTSPDAAPPLTRADLMALLDTLAIATSTIDHAPVFTVEESEHLERDIPGAHTKNLFLKDAKGALFLVVAGAHTAVDLKALSARLAAGRFSFGKAELLMQVLGVTPGSVTAFALANDRTGRVRAVLDQSLLDHEIVNCHPLENAATTSIARADLLAFMRATGHEPVVVDLTAAPPP